MMLAAFTIGLFSTTVAEVVVTTAVVTATVEGVKWLKGKILD